MDELRPDSVETRDLFDRTQAGDRPAFVAPPAQRRERVDP